MPKKKKYFGIILQKSPTINNENDYFYYDYDTQKFNFKLFEKNPYKAQLKQVYPRRSIDQRNDNYHQTVYE